MTPYNPTAKRALLTAFLCALPMGQVSATEDPNKAIVDKTNLIAKEQAFVVSTLLPYIKEREGGSSQAITIGDMDDDNGFFDTALVALANDAQKTVELAELQALVAEQEIYYKKNPSALEGRTVFGISIGTPSGNPNSLPNLDTIKSMCNQDDGYTNLTFAFLERLQEPTQAFEAALNNGYKAYQEDTTADKPSFTKSTHYADVLKTITEGTISSYDNKLVGASSLLVGGLIGFGLAVKFWPKDAPEIFENEFESDTDNSDNQ